MRILVACAAFAAGAAAAQPKLFADAGPAEGIRQLNAAVVAAIEHSASIREAQAAVSAASFDVGEAEGSRRPQVSLDAVSRWTSASGVTNASASYYTVTGTMPVYDFGRLAHVVDSRSAARRAADARLAAGLEQVALETAVAALELGRYRASVAAAEDYITNSQRLVNMLVEITREDRGRLGELTQARARVLQAQVTRDTMQGKLREAEIALERLVGNRTQPIDELAAAFRQVPPLPGLLREAENQPALRQLDAEQQAQASLARSLGSARLPQIGVVVSHAPIAPGVTGGYASYAGISLSVPLYRGGSDEAAQRAAQERANGAQQRRQQSEIDLVARLRTLHETATEQLRRSDDFGPLLTESDNVRRGFFEQWYQMGRRTLFELLAAESDYYSLQSSYLNTYYDGLSASARLRGEAGVLASGLGLRATGTESE